MIKFKKIMLIFILINLLFNFNFPFQASAIHNHHSGFGSIIFNIKECAVRLERCDTKKTKKNISDLPPEIIIINES